MLFQKKRLTAPQDYAAAKQRMLTNNSPFAIREAYNSIRAKLIFTGRGEKCPVFAVTSAMMHDGKTTNAVNLAISIASTTKKVLLVDGDMRKPTVHRYFGLENRNGLSEILAGLTNEVKIRKTEVENLHVLTSGQIPPNPAELFGSRQMDNLLSYVKDFFDYVIIDTPPVNLVTDAAILAEKITGYVFVVQSGKNHYNELSYALETVQQMNGNVVGLVLNDATGKSNTHYGGYRSSYYSSRGYYRRGYSRGYYGSYYGAYETKVEGELQKRQDVSKLKDAARQQEPAAKQANGLRTEAPKTEAPKKDSAQ